MSDDSSTSRGDPLRRSPQRIATSSKSRSSRVTRAASKSASIARILAATKAEFWLLDHEAVLTYVSASFAERHPELAKLTGKSCRRAAACLRQGATADSATSKPPSRHDLMLASLLPPAGLTFGQSKTARWGWPVEPKPATSDAHPETALWLWLGNPDEMAAAPVILGTLQSSSPAVWTKSSGLWPLDDPAEASRFDVQQLSKSWLARADWIQSGTSPAAVTLSRQVRLASRVQDHIALLGYEGGGLRSLAQHIAQAPQASEASPAVVLDGSLMDAELLDAYAQPVIARVNEMAAPGAAKAPDDTTAGSLVIDRINEMTEDAQQRVIEWLQRWPNRWRLIGLIRRRDDDAQQSGRQGQPASPAMLPALRHHLTTLQITVPSLRERREDIAMLATTQVEQCWLQRTDDCDDADWSDPPVIRPEAMDALKLYAWPGDLDELAAAIDHATRHCDGQTIKVADLPLAVRAFPLAPQADRLVIETSPSIDEPLDVLVARFEWQQITEMLTMTDGNKAEAARRLGMTRSRLLRKVSEWQEKAP